MSKPSDEEIEQMLKELAQQHARWGFGKMMARIKKLQYQWNHKRVYRVYCELKLNLRIKPKKRIPAGNAKQLIQPIRPNVCWSMDFMSDALTAGLKFRTFNVMDDYNREALHIEIGFSLPAGKVTECLDSIAITRGYPGMIRVDNGPEFTSTWFKDWAKKHGVLLHHIQPGKPAQNGFIERFNRTYREDILDMYLFDNLDEVKRVTAPWIDFYNNDRPHKSIGNNSPKDFAREREGAVITGAVHKTQHILKYSTSKLS